ncbi:hypothetical protein CKO15_09165 [Halorhodospira abdelmalekii]|uniref:hypothetical protein n=1 Tax=Halorhodospira abdelmalekii TaxID=421629 RepID=UPI001903FFC2|nr:hypothetical protein [Halorhodospira abdelmalekii]MBK1735449.1 hypothetical protein [Halorhodospira abdelmalekii]
MTSTSLTAATIAELIATSESAATAPPRGGGNQAWVRLFPEHDPPLIVKAPLPGLRYATTLWSLRREHRIYQRLTGVPGIPPCYGLYAGKWLVLGYIAGQPLRRYLLQPSPLSDQPCPAMEGFRRTVAAMHRRGIAHADLKRRTNLILTAEQQIYVIDFGTAFLRPSERPPGPLWRWAAQQDWNAWARHGWKHEAAMPPAVARLHRRTAIERIARGVRRLYR